MNAFVPTPGRQAVGGIISPRFDPSYSQTDGPARRRLAANTNRALSSRQAARRAVASAAARYNPYFQVGVSVAALAYEYARNFTGPAQAGAEEVYELPGGDWGPSETSRWVNPLITTWDYNPTPPFTTKFSQTNSSALVMKNFDRYQHFFPPPPSPDAPATYGTWFYGFTVPPYTNPHGYVIGTTAVPYVVPIGDPVPMEEVWPEPAPHVRPAPTTPPLTPEPPAPRARPRPRVRFRRFPRAGIQYDVSMAPRAAPRAARASSTRSRPPRGVQERKVRMAGRAVAIGKAIANAGGEFIEFVDLAAAASGWKYNKWESGTYLQQKMRHLFLEGGINRVNWDEMWDSMLENQIEDWALGKSGQAAGEVGKDIGRVTGVQTGPAL